MKQLFVVFAAVISFVAASGQADQTIPKPEGDVTLTMVDGATLRGFSRSDMVNHVKFFEISPTPKGTRTRYDSDQIARITFDQGAVYEKRGIIATAIGKKVENEWVRIDYSDHGIALYSRLVSYVEQTPTVRRHINQWNYYIALGDDPAVLAAMYGSGAINQTAYNRTTMRYYFNKRYPQYADLAARIKAKEFDVKDSPMPVIEAWVAAYGKDKKEE